MPAILSPEAVASIAEAIFAKAGVRVVEAYSDFDVKPREFSSPAELIDYAKECAKRPSRLLKKPAHHAQ